LFDPIEAIIQASQPGLKPEERAGRIGGEVLSNLPVGQTIAGMYPEYGFSVGDYQAPTRKSLFGREDPTRFGSGLLAAKGLQDPLYKVLPPFGGSQLEKTVSTINQAKEGGSYTKTGQLKYETKITPKSLLFGPNASEQAQNYFNKFDQSGFEREATQLNQLSTKEKAKVQKTANQYYIELKKLKTKSEQSALIDKWDSQGLLDDATSAELGQLLDAAGKPQTSFTKAVNKLSTNDVKAQFIITQIKKMKVKSEQEKLIDELDNAGLLTDALMKKINEYWIE